MIEANRLFFKKFKDLNRFIFVVEGAYEEMVFN